MYLCNVHRSDSVHICPLFVSFATIAPAQISALVPLPKEGHIRWYVHVHHQDYQTHQATVGIGSHLRLRRLHRRSGIVMLFERVRTRLGGVRYFHTAHFRIFLPCYEREGRGLRHISFVVGLDSNLVGWRVREGESRSRWDCLFR